MEERLQKLMAQAGLGSRRENEQLIAAGRVLLNGRVARLGDKADPLVDRIEQSRLLRGRGYGRAVGIAAILAGFFAIAVDAVARIEFV